MGLKLVKTESSGGIPVFLKEFEVATGGFKLETTGLPADEIVPVGNPMYGDEETRKATVLKTAVLYEASIAADVAASGKVTIGGVEYTISAAADDADDANGIVIKFVEGTEGVAWDGNELTVTLTTDSKSYTNASIQALIRTATSNCPDGFTVASVTVAGTGTSDLSTAVLNASVTLAGGSEAQDYKVKKGHFLVVGEYVGATVGGAAYAISAIDTSNADYDIITLATTLGALDAGTVLFKSSATGATNAALHVTPNGLLLDYVKIEDNVSCSLVIRGTVYKKRVANGIHSAVQTALPNIIFNNSY